MACGEKIKSMNQKSGQFLPNLTKKSAMFRRRESGGRDELARTDA